MNPHTYQRQVVAYHGCDRQTFEQALIQGEKLRPSERPWDWLLPSAIRLALLDFSAQPPVVHEKIVEQTEFPGSPASMGPGGC